MDQKQIDNIKSFVSANLYMVPKIVYTVWLHAQVNLLYVLYTPILNGNRWKIQELIFFVRNNFLDVFQKRMYHWPNNIRKGTICDLHSNKIVLKPRDVLILGIQVHEKNVI